MDLDLGPVPTQFVGSQVANYTHVLKSPNPSICQLHGNVEDFSSWILTAAEMSARLSNPGYRNSITRCLSAKTIVLVGMSADDTAVGGFLDQLADLDVGDHFWFTHGRDFKTREWAEAHGIRLINYDEHDGDHTELLEAFDYLVAYIPSDDPANSEPIIPEGLTTSNDLLPGQDILLTVDAESLRGALNREATRFFTRR